jgi:purine-nucleoside phosphorylase
MSTTETFTHDQVREAADAVRLRTHHQPHIGLILGSGLNPLAEQVEDAERISYTDIPHFAVPTVVGHTGRIVVGRLAGHTVLVMQGRTHAYEGYSLQRVTLPVRVMAELGVETLILTNAAGGINPTYRVGDLMLIEDHIGLMAMTGGNPLWGPNDDALGPRFPAMNRAYDPALRRIAVQVAAGLDIPLRRGVYCGLGGPSFETPAEVRFLRMIGADAVGMSTVPEVIVARHAGMRVLGFSGISNAAAHDLDSAEEANHEEVLAAGQVIVPRLVALIRGVLSEMPLPDVLAMQG